LNHPFIMCNDAGAKLWVDNSGLQNRLPYACFVVGQRPHDGAHGGEGWLTNSWTNTCKGENESVRGLLL